MEFSRTAREGAGLAWAVFEGGLALLLALVMIGSVLGLGYVILTAIF